MRDVARVLVMLCATMLGLICFPSTAFAVTPSDTTKPVLTSVSLASATTLRPGDAPQIRWTASDENAI